MPTRSTGTRWPVKEASISTATANGVGPDLQPVNDRANAANTGSQEILLE